MNSQHDLPTGDGSEAFITQVMGLQRNLYAFILNLTHVIGDADDVLQEVNLVLWSKRGEFTPGTNFQAWAFRIARFQVMAWRKRQSRDRLQMSEELVEKLADQSANDFDQFEDRRHALAVCVEKLRDVDQALLKARYAEGLSAKELAARDGRTPDGIYYALNRIQQSLTDCVHRALQSEERPQ